MKQLTEEQKRILLNRLNKGIPCPICESEMPKFIDTNVYALHAVNEVDGKFAVGGMAVYQPLAVIRCIECSYMMLFNAATIGLVKNNF